MSIVSWGDYKAKLAAPTQEIDMFKSSITVVTARHYDMFAATPFAGTVPSTAVICDKTTDCAMNFQRSFTNQRLISVGAHTSTMFGGSLLYDRLAHCGGLSGTVTTAQTINTPTLTRYTNGVGVMAAIHIYSAIGSTLADCTVTYVNSDNATKTSPVFFVGGNTLNAAGRILYVPLASGDKGIKSITSLTLSVSTGTAGNFGIYLFKPLLMIQDSHYGSDVRTDAFFRSACQLPQIYNNACLCLQTIAYTSSAGNKHFSLDFVDDDAINESGGPYTAPPEGI